MSRKPPTIVAIYPLTDGSLRIEWDLDRFFEDPEHPEELEEPHQVWVELPTGPLPPMDGSSRSFDIPAELLEAYAGGQLTGSVVFRWAGPPDDVLASAFGPIPVAGGGSRPGGSGQVPQTPVVTVVARHPKTSQRPNRITISWSSYSYTHGLVIWGPATDPERYTHKFRPRGTVYTGEFTTDQPLSPRTAYRFLVRVENRSETRTAETAITVVSRLWNSGRRQDGQA